VEHIGYGGHIEGYNKYSRYDGHEKRVKNPL